MKVGLSEDAELYKRNPRCPESGMRRAVAVPLRGGRRRILDSEVRNARESTPVMDFTYSAELARGR
jgi:hypothetical protein